MSLLQQAQVNPTQGDTRCIVFGHLIRLAAWNLRSAWNSKSSVADRMAKVQNWARDFGGADTVIKDLGTAYNGAPARQHWELLEAATPYKTRADEISF